MMKTYCFATGDRGRRAVLTAVLALMGSLTMSTAALAQSGNRLSAAVTPSAAVGGELQVRVDLEGSPMSDVAQPVIVELGAGLEVIRAAGSYVDGCRTDGQRVTCTVSAYGVRFGVDDFSVFVRAARVGRTSVTVRTDDPAVPPVTGAVEVHPHARAGRTVMLHPSSIAYTQRPGPGFLPVVPPRFQRSGAALADLPGTGVVVPMGATLMAGSAIARCKADEGPGARLFCPEVYVTAQVAGRQRTGRMDDGLIQVRQRGSKRVELSVDDFSGCPSLERRRLNILAPGAGFTVATQAGAPVTWSGASTPVLVEELCDGRSSRITVLSGVARVRDPRTGRTIRINYSKSPVTIRR